MPFSPSFGGSEGNLQQQHIEGQVWCHWKFFLKLWKIYFFIRSLLREIFLFHVHLSFFPLIHPFVDYSAFCNKNNENRRWNCCIFFWRIHLYNNKYSFSWKITSQFESWFSSTSLAAKGAGNWSLWPHWRFICMY